MADWCVRHTTQAYTSSFVISYNKEMEAELGAETEAAPGTEEWGGEDLILLDSNSSKNRLISFFLREAFLLSISASIQRDVPQICCAFTNLVAIALFEYLTSTSPSCLHKCVSALLSATKIHT